MRKNNTIMPPVFRLIAVLICVSCTLPANSQSKTEAILIGKIIRSLQIDDSLSYASVFLPIDSMAQMTIRKAPASSEAYQNALQTLSNPVAKALQDSLIKDELYLLFRKTYERGEKMDINWEAVVQTRYELEKMATTRNKALEAIAPERFMGYVSIEDMLSRRHFMFSISDMMAIGGKWYGGELNFLFEAQSKDEFKDRMKAEMRRIAKGLPDTLGHYRDSVRKAMIASGELEESSAPLKRKQVVDRKYYFGYLDDEIPVRIYVRALKGDCETKICNWEAIMKFGDDEYLRQEVSKDTSGKWVFSEDVFGGVLEVEVKDRIMEGTFLETNDRISYDAYLKERDISPSRIENLDAIIEEDIER